MMFVRLDGARRTQPFGTDGVTGSIALGGYLGTAFPSDRPLSRGPSRSRRLPWWRRVGLHAVPTAS